MFSQCTQTGTFRVLSEALLARTCFPAPRTTVPLKVRTRNGLLLLFCFSPCSENVYGLREFRDLKFVAEKPLVLVLSFFFSFFLFVFFFSFFFSEILLFCHVRYKYCFLRHCVVSSYVAMINVGPVALHIVFFLVVAVSRRYFLPSAFSFLLLQYVMFWENSAARN